MNTGNFSIVNFIEHEARTALRNAHILEDETGEIDCYIERLRSIFIDRTEICRFIDFFRLLRAIQYTNKYMINSKQLLLICEAYGLPEVPEGEPLRSLVIEAGKRNRSNEEWKAVTNLVRIGHDVYVDSKRARDFRFRADDEELLQEVLRVEGKAWLKYIARYFQDHPEWKERLLTEVI